MSTKRISEEPSSMKPAPPALESAESERGRGWLKAGLTRERAGWYEGAADAYLTVLHGEVRPGPALLGLGRVYFALGQFEPAGLFLEALLLSDPGLPEGRLLLGLIRYRQGQDLAAIRLLSCREQPTRLRLDWPEARECLGDCHYRRGDYLNAILVWLPLLEQARRPERTLLNLGAALFRLGRYASAYVFYRKAIARNPESAGALNNAAVACYELGDRAEARRWLEQSLHRDPFLATARENLRLMSAESQPRRAVGGKDQP